MPTFDEDVIVNGTVSARDGFRPSTSDWEIARNGEHLEIREPEQADKVWASFNDDRSLHLIGTPSLIVDGGPSQNTVLLGNTTTKGLRLRDTGGAVDLESFGVSLFINNGGRNTFINPQGGGNVGVGTTNPQAKLHVQGDIRVSGDIVLDNADCAEEFEVSALEQIEPGTVMVLYQKSWLQQCTKAYDKKVAGIVSGAGSYKPGLILDKKDGQHHRVPIALMGKVFCKVDAQYSPIEIGDLLTSSPTPGHAMKATDPSQAFGTVIGKALESFDCGTGLIPVLVSLQ